MSGEITHLNRQGEKSVRQMAVHRRIRQFFLPSLTPMFLIRVFLVSLCAYLFFGFVCIPFTIQGISMEPTYPDGGVNFCWRLRYLFSEPERHDVVAVRFAGRRVMLLKRVVAQEGEQVEFRAGRLYVNGKEMEEPYVRFPCNWNLSARRVEKDCVYVVGDNRSMPIENHHFGQTSKIRIIGVPLW
jgi:signal peptidase I